ncbi:nucleotidyltransferase domain-containing protein [uncultured Clostridium sp.]|uniref:nucleotidyltransferase domain-containing protein n=1 Tax=uncultured Clostridium sp. TaxID=59620 RepID=UPI0025D3A06D|nr:nucleotidyltransferase domain-containing protein [uncultured Clostridium sp.]
MKLSENLEKIISEFSKLKNVEGILLAGSKAVNTDDKNSDYDVYVYASEEISLEYRKNIYDKYCSYMELNNTFWETEDDGILKEDNIPVEIIYRSLEWIQNSLNRTIVKCEADVGYTTCFWYNVKNSIILYDKDGKLKEIQNSCNVEYPEKLKENIIKKNYPLLNKQMPAYYFQIEKAIKRNDIISVNHRVAALLASYFDIIFAANKFLHPGEKKLIKIIKDNRLYIPNNMEENINNILKYSAEDNGKLLNEINVLVDNLDKYLKR